MRTTADFCARFPGALSTMRRKLAKIRKERPELSGTLVLAGGRAENQYTEQQFESISKYLAAHPIGKRGRPSLTQEERDRRDQERAEKRKAKGDRHGSE